MDSTADPFRGGIIRSPWREIKQKSNGKRRVAIIRRFLSEIDLERIKIEEKQRKKKKNRDKDFVDKKAAHSDILKIPTKKLVQKNGCI